MTGDSAQPSVRYTRDFLLSFKDKCTDKPENLLADLDAIFGPSAAGPKKNFRETRKGSKKKKGDKKGDKQQFTPPSFGGALDDVKKLESTENRWVPSIQSQKPEGDEHASQEEDEEALRLKREKEEDDNVKKARGILNKLTPERFDSLFKKFADLPCTTERMLEKLADAVFTKALDEQAFSSSYAELARRLVPQMPKFPAVNEDGEEYDITFQLVLVSKCEEKFFAPPPFDDLEDMPEGEEKDEKLSKMRRHIFGNVKFISELFKLKIIPDKTMHEWVMELLNLNPANESEEQPSELDVEQVSVVLTNVGNIMDNEKGSRFVQQYFDTLKGISNDKEKYSSRIRFMVQDLLDLRGNNWVPRRDAVVNPQTLEEVRAEMEQKQKEEQEAANALLKKENSWFGKGSKTPSSKQMYRTQSDISFNREEKRPASAKPAKGKGGRGFADEKWKGGGRDEKRKGAGTGGSPSGDDGWTVKGSDGFSSVRSGKKGGRVAEKGRGRGGGRGAVEKSPFGGKGRSGQLSRDGFVTRNNSAPLNSWRKQEPAEVKKQNAFSLLVSESDNGEEEGEEEEEVTTTSKEGTPEATPEKMSVKKVSYDVFERKANLLIDEYISVKSEEETRLSLEELRGLECEGEASSGAFVVFKTVYKLMDEGDKVFNDLVNLVSLLQKGSSGLSPEEIEEGFALGVRDLDDLAIDIPLAPKRAGMFVARLVNDEMYSLKSLRGALKDITEFGMSERVLIATLNELISLQGKEEMQEAFSRTGLRLLDFFRPGTDEEGAKKAFAIAGDDLAAAVEGLSL
eukprot:CAMPEP_0113910156 /NCGR_PEP_ID=MMETSP0780_2-20120614/27339_1 /TAXON_ID=652834 /ORGANISM="Palpitomonas bilix" /LENGTH=795 /DNA_ID=CAMNT_0000906221 /DNA_START=109 /DNA_END=2496 /DNA_ORIENTATION=- /assembly_acc=CAM_ASM_000599